MLEQIFDTKIKIKILKVFFNNSNKAFQTLDIANFAKISSSRASECLNHLVNIGILSSQKIGKGYLFRINQSNYFVKIILNGEEIKEGLHKDLVYYESLGGFEYNQFKSYLQSRIDPNYDDIFCSNDDDFDYTK